MPSTEIIPAWRPLSDWVGANLAKKFSAFVKPDVSALIVILLIAFVSVGATLAKPTNAPIAPATVFTPGIRNGASWADAFNIVLVILLSRPSESIKSNLLRVLPSTVRVSVQRRTSRP